ncbi:hypothetical protein [Microbacterium arborescens]|uniref:hypothetical protein n=1 Tax=Microbacterium arborescens TaxID=33883 RepID=UPI00278940D9|nr:hypothetical protein [Microbacterium arborescens]MDQ1218115.1 hypothetical protein [Microbacterium arborescens]
MIAFLDMHLDRGRYADQSKILTAGIAVGKDLSLTPIQLNMADRIVLSQFMEGSERLSSHGMESWHWEVRKARDLITGDGAVVLWQGEKDGALVGVGFPLAPDKLLVIGPNLPEQPNFNEMVRNRSRRWLVGQRGQFTRRR